MWVHNGQWHTVITKIYTGTASNLIGQFTRKTSCRIQALISYHKWSVTLEICIVKNIISSKFGDCCSKISAYIISSKYNISLFDAGNLHNQVESHRARLSKSKPTTGVSKVWLIHLSMWHSYTRGRCTFFGVQPIAIWWIWLCRELKLVSLLQHCKMHSFNGVLCNTNMNRFSCSYLMQNRFLP